MARNSQRAAFLEDSIVRQSQEERLFGSVISQVILVCDSAGMYSMSQSRDGRFKLESGRPRDKSHLNDQYIVVVLIWCINTTISVPSIIVITLSREAYLLPASSGYLDSNGRRDIPQRQRNSVTALTPLACLQSGVVCINKSRPCYANQSTQGRHRINC
jgi:hypothetical protein